MLKRNFKILLVLSIIALFLFASSYVLAANETDTVTANDVVTAVNQASEAELKEAANAVENAATEAVENAAENMVEEAVTEAVTEAEKASEDSSIKKGDVYINGDNVTIDYVVDGNLFIMANKVTINSEIGGDAFILANDVTIGDQGYIFSNLFTAASKVTVNGVVYDIYATCTDFYLSGYVYRDIKAVASNKITLVGTVGRNAMLYGTSNIVFTETENDSLRQGSVTGNLDYYANSENAQISNYISGQVNYHQLAETDNNIATYLVSYAVYLIIISFVTAIVLFIVVWLISLWLAPNFAKESGNVLKKGFIPSLGLGLISLFLFPMLAILCLLCPFTSGIGIALFALYIVLLLIGSAIFGIAITNILCEKLKIEKKLLQLLILILISIVLWALSLIPIVGIAISVLVMIIGMGMIFKYLFDKNKKEETK